MKKTWMAVALLALAGCAGLPAAVMGPDPCAGNEASYDCQVLRYRNTQ